MVASTKLSRSRKSRSILSFGSSTPQGRRHGTDSHRIRDFQNGSRLTSHAKRFSHRGHKTSDHKHRQRHGDEKDEQSCDREERHSKTSSKRDSIRTRTIPQVQTSDSDSSDLEASGLEMQNCNTRSPSRQPKHPFHMFFDMMSELDSEDLSYTSDADDKLNNNSLFVAESDKMHDIITQKKILSKAKARFRTLSAGIIELKAKIKQKDEDTKSAMARLDSLRQTNASLTISNLEIDALMKQTQQVEQQKKDADAKVRNYDIECANKEAELSIEQGKFSRLQAKSAQLQATKKGLEQQLKENEEFLLGLTDIQQDIMVTNAEMVCLHERFADLKGLVKVIVRCKPCELKEQPSERITFKRQESILVTEDARSHKKKHDFVFTKVLPPKSTQTDTFSALENAVCGCFDGVSATVLVYGPKGSGKTYTVLGTPSQPGLLFHVFRRMARCRQEKGLWNFKLSGSIVKIQRNAIFDMLSEDPNSEVGLIDNGNDVALRDVEKVELTHEEDFQLFLEHTHVIEATSAQEKASQDRRPHFAIMINVFGENVGRHERSEATFSIIDAAGFNYPPGRISLLSRSVTFSHAALSRVMADLRRRVKPSFRCSKLTHFLRPSLSGGARFLLLVTLSIAQKEEAIGVRTLKFAAKMMSTELGQARKRLLMTTIGEQEDRT